jgi:hypothetical protein
MNKAINEFISDFDNIVGKCPEQVIYGDGVFNHAVVNSIYPKVEAWLKVKHPEIANNVDLELDFLSTLDNALLKQFAKKEDICSYNE